MSFPLNLIENSQNYYNLQDISNSQDFLYLQSLRETDGLSAKSIQNNKSEQKEELNNSQYNKFSQFIDFDHGTQMKLQTESGEQINQTSLNNIEEYRKSLTEYYARNSTHINQLLQNRLQNPFTLQYELQDDAQILKEQSLQPWNFDNIKGNNPSNWPKDLPQFVEEFELKRAPCSLFLEPEQNQAEFLIKAKKALEDQLKSDDTIDHAIQILKSLLLITLHRGDFLKVIEMVQFIQQTEQKIQKSLSSKTHQKFVSKLPEFGKLIEENLENCVKNSQNSVDKQVEHLPSFCNMGAFNVEHIGYMQKLGFLHTSLTCCQKYLFLVLGSTSGAMLKIGTGKKGTQQGKVYIYKPVAISEEQVSWVYIQNKLYYRTSSLGTSIQIFNPDTLASEGFIQLQCRELFSSTLLSQLNNKLQLLSEGNYLYIVGKLLNTSKIVIEEEEVEKSEEKGNKKVEEKEKGKENGQKKQIEKNDEKLETIQEQKTYSFEEKLIKGRGVFEKKTTAASKKVAKKKQIAEKSATTNSNSAANAAANLEKGLLEDKYNHILEFYLYKFDIQQTSEKAHDDVLDKEQQDLAKELQVSFNNFYTLQECHKALWLSANDIQKAAMWLVDEGENERKKKTISLSNRTLLAQSQIIGTNKDLKHSELQTAENSLILYYNTYSNCWTINETSISLYSEHGIKVFSTNQEDLKEFDYENYRNYRQCYISQQQIVSKEEQTLNQNIQKEKEIMQLLEDREMQYNRICDQIDEIDNQIDLATTKVIDKKAEEQLITFQKTRERLELEKMRFGDRLREAEEQHSKFIQKLQQQKKIIEQKSQNSQKKLKKSLQNQKYYSTFIKVVNKQNGFESNPRYNITYDNISEMYYTINYSCNYSQFPALITYSQNKKIPTQQSEQQSKKCQEANEQQNKQKMPVNCEDLLIFAVEKLQEIQKYRFQKLPWKLNSWEHFYGLALAEIQNEKEFIQRLENDGLNLNNPVDSFSENLVLKKKQLQNQKQTLLKRLNKQIEKSKNNKQFQLSVLKNNGKLIQEVKKNYAFCLNGNVEELFFLAEYLEKQINNTENVKTALKLLNLWTLFAEITVVYKKNALVTLEKIQQLLKNLLKKEEVQEILIDVIVNGFTFFCYSSELQFEWLPIIFQNSKLLKKFYKKHVDNHNQSNKNYILQEVLLNQITRETEIQQKSLESNTKFSQIYKKTTNLEYQNYSFQEPLGRLLLKDLNYLPKIFTDNNGSFEKIHQNYYFLDHFVRDLYDKYEEISNNNKSDNAKKQLKKTGTSAQQQLQKEQKQNLFKTPTRTEKQPAALYEEEIDEESNEIIEKINQNSEKSKEIIQKKSEGHEKNYEKFMKFLEILFESQEEQNFDAKTFIYQQNLLAFLTEKTWEELSKFQEGAMEWTQKSHFSGKLLSIYTKQLEFLYNQRNSIVVELNSDEQREQEEEEQNEPQNKRKSSESYSDILENTAQSVNKFLYLLFQSSVTYVPSEGLVEKMNNLWKKLQDILNYFKKNLEVPQEIFNQIMSQKQPGLHHSAYRVFQTSHPYEKGQQIFFDKIYWKDAIGILIEQDPRNSSDQHDSLTISGWYGGSINNNNQNNNQHQLGRQEGLYSSYRLNGRQTTQQLKKPIFILGNSLKVEFQSQSQVRQGGDGITIWGYKIIARPVYGLEVSQQQGSFEGSYRYLNSLLNVAKFLKLSVLQTLKNYLQSPALLDQQQVDILSYYNLHQQSLFSNGLIDCDTKKYLQKPQSNCNGTSTNNSIIKRESESVYKSKSKAEICTDVLQLQAKIMEINIGSGSRFSRSNDLFGNNSSSQLSSSKNSNCQLPLELFARIYNCTQFSMFSEDQQNGSEPKTQDNLDEKPQQLQIQEKLKEEEEQQQQQQKKKESEGEVLVWTPENFSFLDHIKEYIEQIRDTSGKFVDFALELKQQMTLPNNYRMEKMRPTFKQDYKNLWEKCEILFILVQLYHNGLLQKPLQESVNELIKGQIQQGIADTNRQILSYMITCIQDQKELQFCIESLHRKQNELQTNKQEEKKKNYIKQQEEIQKQKQEQQKIQEQTNGNTIQNNNGQQQQSNVNGNTQQPVKKIQKVQKHGKKIIISTKKPADKPIQKTQNKNKSKNKKEDKQEEIVVEEKNFALNDEEKSEIKKQLQEYFTKEVCNGTEKILQICKATGTVKDYSDEDLQETSEKLFKICILKLENHTGFNISPQNKLEFDSPYFIVAKQIIQKTLLLLTLRNTIFTSQQSAVNGDVKDKKEEDQLSENNDFLAPPSIKRVISAPLSEKNIKNKEKLQYFRQQMESYTHFKQQQQKQLDNYNDEANTGISTIQDQIVNFMKLPLQNSESILKSYERQNQEIAKRINTLSILNNNLQNQSSEESLDFDVQVAYQQGYLSNLFNFDTFENVHCANKDLKNAYIVQLNTYLETLLAIFNQNFLQQVQQSTHLELLEKLQQQALAAANFSREENSSSAQQNQQNLKNNKLKSKQRIAKDTFENHLKKTENKKCLTLFQDQIQCFYLQIIEIHSVLASKSVFKNQEFQQKFIEGENDQLYNFLQNSFQLSLLCQNFAYLSQELQDLKKLSENLSDQTQKLLTTLTQSNCSSSSVLPQNILNLLLKLLQQELGFVKPYSNLLDLSKNEDYQEIRINARILARMFDISGIERIGILLQNIQQVLTIQNNKNQIKQLFSKNNLDNLATLMLVIVYHSNSPSVLKMTCKILCEISQEVELAKIRNPTEFTYKLHSFNLPQSEAQQQFDLILQQLQNNSNTSNNNNNTLDLAAQYYQNIQKVMNEQKSVKTDEITLDYPKNKDNLTLLLEKLGGLIFQNKQPGSAGSNPLQTKLEKIIEDSKNQCISKYSKKLNKNLAEKNKSQGSEDGESLYVVLLHLQEEEDLSFLLDTFYHIEKLNPTFTKEYPQNYEQYLEFEKERKQKEKQQIQERKELQEQRKNPNKQNLAQNLQYLQQFVNIPERIMQNLPYINNINLENQDECDLPLGWQLNYTGLFADFKPQVFSQFQSNEKLKVPAKKTWENKGLKSLLQKFQHLDVNISNLFNQQIEKDQANADKLKENLVNSHNFIRQILQHVCDLSLIANLTNILGFAPVLEKGFSFQQAQELADLLNYGIQKKMQKIPLSQLFEKEERLQEILDPYNVDSSTYQVKSLEKPEKKEEKPQQNPPASKKPASSNNNNNKNAQQQQQQQQQNGGSNIITMICKSNLYPLLENSKTQLLYLDQNVKHENFYIEANSTRSIHANTDLAQSNLLSVQELTTLLEKLLGKSQNYEAFQQVAKEVFQRIPNKETGNLSLILGVLTAFTGSFTEHLLQGSKLKISDFNSKNKQEKYVLATGGQNSGLQKCGVYSSQDNTLELHNFGNEELKNQEISILGDKKMPHFNLFLKALDQQLECELSIENQLILRQLLQIASKLLWNDQKQQEENQQLLQKIIQNLQKLVQLCPSDRSHEIYEEYLLEHWQQFTNYQSNFYQIPKLQQENEEDEDNLNDDEFAQDYQEKLYDFINYETDMPSLKKEPSKIQHYQESISNFSQPMSEFNNSLPEIDQKVEKNYLLIHWQKQIFPKVEAYCKGTLQTWEVKMAIAQISNHIIQGQVKEAIKELYIICDQKPPPGCDTQSIMAYQDTTTLPIDEIKVGEFYLCNIFSTNNPNSIIFQFLKPQQILQNNLIVVQALAMDIRSSSILVLFSDHMYNQVYSFWVHISQIKYPSIPIKHQACELKAHQLKQNLQQSLQNSIKLFSRNTLIQFFNLQQSQNLMNQNIINSNLVKDYSLNLIELLKWTVLDELSVDPQKDWQKVNSNTLNLSYQCEQEQADTVKKPLKIHTFQTVLNDLCRGAQKGAEEQKILQELITYSEMQLKETTNFIQTKAYFGDLKNQHKKNALIIKEEPNAVNDSNELLPLNLYSSNKPNEAVSQIIVVFKEDSKLSKCSGLNVFHDQQATKPLQGIHAGKNEQKQNLQPLVFSGNQIYTQYYFDQSTAMDKDERDFSKLECLVYIIPTNWSVLCWLIDTLGSALTRENSQLNVQNLQKLLCILIQNFTFLNGPNIIKQVLVQLITRTVNKLQYLLQNQEKIVINTQNQLQSLGIQDKFITDCLKEIEEFHQVQTQDKTTLFSSYLQDYAEMVATILTPIQQKSIPNDTTTDEEQEFFVKTVEFQMPNCVKQLLQSQILINYMQDTKHNKLSEDLYRKCLKQIDTENMFNNILYLENLPENLKAGELKEHLLQVVSQFKGRILDPSKDIYIPVVENNEEKQEKHKGIAYILLDEVNALEINTAEEQEEEEKKEQDDEAAKDIPEDQEDEEEEEEEEPKEEKKWACAVCTVHNDWDLNTCDVCGSPEPPNKQPVREEVQEPQEEEPQEEKKTDDDLIDEEIKIYQEKYEIFVQNIQKSLNSYKENQNQLNIQKQIKEYLEKKEKEKQEKENGEQQQKEVEKQENNAEEQNQQSSQQQQQPSKSKKQKKLEKKLLKQQRTQQSEQEKQEKQEKELQLQQEKEKEQKILQEQKEKEIQEEQKQIEEIKKQTITPVKVTQSLDEIEKRDEESVKQNLQAFLFKKLTQKSGEYIELEPKLALKLVQNIKTIYENDKNVEICEDFLNILQALFLSEELEFDISDPEAFKTNFFLLSEQDAVSAFKILQMFGYDFWLNQVNYLPYETPKLLDSQTLQQLIQFVENTLCTKSNNTLNYPPMLLRLINNFENAYNYYSQTSLLEYKNLMKLKDSEVKDLRFSWSVIRLLNYNFMESLKFTNFQQIQSSSSSQGQKYNEEERGTFSSQTDKIELVISNKISTLRNLCFHSIKSDLIQNVLKKTAKKRADDLGESAPKVIIDRIKISQQNNGTSSSKQQQQKKQKKTEFIFESAYQQLKNVHTSQMRPSHEPFIAFDITLKGEQAQGQYGLYRQIFSDISAELQPNKTSNIQRNLNLLIPCENNLSKEGENQDKFILNPSAKSSHDLQLYEFFGVLMGCCIRTGVTLALDLPRLFWKQIVGENVVKRDLEEIEKSFQNLSKNIKNGSKEEVEYYLSELGIIESQKLKNNKEHYSYENRHIILDELFRTRVSSTDLQIEAIQSGLQQIIPRPLLKIISNQELEYMVCGSKTVDFAMLKRHTEYKKPLKENSNLVKYFWEAVNELTPVEQLKFIKFCWAQERLPASDEEFEKKKINLGLKPALYNSAVKNPDKCLPKADTCFFNLELPNYSSKDILKKQLIIAITFDNDAIDNDNDPNLNNSRSRRYSYGDDEEE